ncbi:serine/threonine protein kinase [Sarcoptes scabiei]|nr:hypothetical protein QR98_0102770 [Sarcoptes scabiei]UXI17159.1 serine/threonine protein kinase [Sarcoptes scabiei]
MDQKQIRLDVRGGRAMVQKRSNKPNSNKIDDDVESLLLDDPLADEYCSQVLEAYDTDPNSIKPSNQKRSSDFYIKSSRVTLSNSKNACDLPEKKLRLSYQSPVMPTRDGHRAMREKNQANLSKSTIAIDSRMEYSEFISQVSETTFPTQTSSRSLVNLQSSQQMLQASRRKHNLEIFRRKLNEIKTEIDENQSKWKTFESKEVSIGHLYRLQQKLLPNLLPINQRIKNVEERLSQLKHHLKVYEENET